MFWLTWPLSLPSLRVHPRVSCAAAWRLAAMAPASSDDDSWDVHPALADSQGGGAAPWLAAAAPRAVVTRADIGRLGPAISPKQAHRLLWALRDEHPRWEEGFVDLTDQPWWRPWVASRNDAAEVIGEGIFAFWFVYVDALDSNLATLRTDFMVRRVDGTDVRLHPQSGKNAAGLREAKPVVGAWEEWRVQDGVPKAKAPNKAAPAASRGVRGIPGPRPVTAPDGYSYLEWSQADEVGRRQLPAEAMRYRIEEGLRILDGRLAAWLALDHPRGPFRCELPKEQWPHELLHVHYHMLPHVGSMGIAWSNSRDRPVFVGTTSDRRQCPFALDPRATPMLSWRPDTSDR